MTQINYEEEHRKLWNWLADHPEAEKDDYFDNWGHDSIPYNECFACEAALQEANCADAGDFCSFCPLGGESVVGCDSGLFDQWWKSVAPKTRRRLARKIANLPWKEVSYEAD